MAKLIIDTNTVYRDRASLSKNRANNLTKPANNIMLFYRHNSSALMRCSNDELLIEIAPGEAEAVEALLKEQMGGAAELSVPLDVAVGRGRTWREAAH